MSTAAEKVKVFIDEVNGKQCKEIYDFSQSQIGIREISQIAATLSSGKCPPRLTLNLQSNNLGVAEIKCLAEALQTGNCPKGLTLYLGNNNMDPEGAILLANALQSGKCPLGLKLELGQSNLGPAEAKLFVEALRSGNSRDYLYGFTLDFGPSKFFGNIFGNAEAKLFAEILASDNCPRRIVVKGIYWSSKEINLTAKTKAMATATVDFGEAWHYENGVGVQKNLQTAFKLYKQALALGHKEAESHVTRLDKKLNNPSSVNSEETKHSKESNYLLSAPPSINAEKLTQKTEIQPENTQSPLPIDNRSENPRRHLQVSSLNGDQWEKADEGNKTFLKAFESSRQQARELPATQLARKNKCCLIQ